MDDVNGMHKRLRCITRRSQRVGYAICPIKEYAQVRNEVVAICLPSYMR
jgi:ferredoxin-thioredoxin reductase catalytic subunit